MAIELFKGIRPLTRASALRDALAGVTLASMNIPQLLGYARIAGMPAVTGLYTGFLPMIAFAIFGASRHLVVAADSATATIFSSRVASLAAPSSPEYVALAGIVALLTALLLLIARVFRLGFLADFLSRTVLTGFLAGVGVQVGVAMMGDMLGLTYDSSRTTEQILQLVRQWHDVHWPTPGLSALVVAAILIFRRYAPRVPVPLVAVVAGIVASAAANFAGHGIAVIGPVQGGLPRLHLPRVSWPQMLDMLQVAASCFAIIVAQSAATSRAFAGRYGESVDDDANLLGLAAANAAAAMSGAFVVNGSLTQTAMADQAGARSQFAQLVFALVVLVVLLFLSHWLQYLPRCILAAIVFTIAFGLIHVPALRDIRAESPGEFSLALVTAAAVVVIGVENGILLAIALSLLRHVRHSYLPHTMMLVPNTSGRWLPVPAQAGLETAPGLIVYRFGADLFYANEHRFNDEVRLLIEHAPAPVRWFVVDAGAITDIDYSAGRSVCALCSDLARQDIGIVFARVSRYLRSDMDRHGITLAIGPEHVFETLHEALAVVHPDIGVGAEA
ncbi:SulP family inorganic anion transporter [Burkholderia sp. WAC0059]|uniref:SulP family inorganic anion transporter n=1 Tax=Burkholderia sp. WAC0059 TaxID=2066022 RepID=UPI002155F41B|nr:SulP family inorganic anion transporter [Burkholderia sp. WAC0059]